jgi:dipeptidyl aminopeptidase/acylaminoacyl peptidase
VRRTINASLVAAFLLCTVCVRNAEAARPLEIETFLHARMFAQDMLPAVTPDGQWVAYTIVRREPADPSVPVGCPAWPLGNDVSCEVWITNARTGESTDLTGAGEEAWAPSWSSDGRSLAFFASTSAGLTLRCWDRATQKLRTVTPSAALQATTDAPQWAASNKAVVVRLADTSPRPTPSAANAVVTVLTAPPRTVFSTSGATTTQPSSRIGLLNMDSGELRPLETSGNSISWYGVSPNQRYLAYTAFEASTSPADASPLTALHVVDLLSGQGRLVATHSSIPSSGPVSWSPNSRSLAFMTAAVTYHARRARINGDCFVVDLANSLVREVTRGQHTDFGYGQDLYVRPLWDPTGRYIYLLSFYYAAEQGSDLPGGDSIWRADVQDGALRLLSKTPGKTILAIISSSISPYQAALTTRGKLLLLERDVNAKTAAISWVDPVTGANQVVYKAPKALGNPTTGDTTPLFAVAAPGDQVLTTAEDSSHLSELWRFSGDFRSNARLTQLNPWQRDYAFGTSQVMTWRDKWGRRYHGALLLPADFSSHVRYPLIVNLYPGDALSNMANVFGIEDKDVINMQLFATRGYAALSADSATTGAGAPMQSIFHSVMPGVDMLVRDGIADPNRMAIIGESFGGYGVLSVLVNTSRFAAAVDDSGGYINWFSMAGIMDPGGGNVYGQITQSFLGGTIWSTPRSYFDASPLMFLNRISTPVLIGQGTADYGDVTQSDELYNALARLGKPVQYAVYANEDHGSWQYHYQNLVDFYHRVISWFGTYLNKN